MVTIEINITENDRVLFESEYGPLGEYPDGHVIGVLRSICDRKGPKKTHDENVTETLQLKAVNAIIGALYTLANMEETNGE